MPVPLYMDEHVLRAITDGLRRRAVDVITAQEDGNGGMADPELLNRATSLKRALVTSDHHFEIEAARRQKAEVHFSGIIFIRAGTISIAKCIEELELIGTAGNESDVVNALLYLPL